MITKMTSVALMLASPATLSKETFEQASVRCQLNLGWDIVAVGIVGDLSLAPRLGKITRSGRRQALCMKAWAAKQRPPAILNFEKL